jgi:hypothetical protein
MKRILLLCTVLASACAAPAGEDDSVESTSDALANNRWLEIYECDGGAVVDVNEGERKQLQLVIRNHDAAEYILAHGNDYMRGMTRNAKGELVMGGSTDRGVFHPHDLLSFRGYGNQQWPIYDVIKYPGGVKVSLLGNDRNEAANWWFPNCR